MRKTWREKGLVGADVVAYASAAAAIAFIFALTFGTMGDLNFSYPDAGSSALVAESSP
ncbi:hypothetical protein [Aureimonas leprariae]|uniref:hypothetical protein n=1 Tax=Plantimonas leprariae TaxID=2615207 RepID=UPI001386F3D9|nr:hypothetical protein [Aureimonas leprariae]